MQIHVHDTITMAREAAEAGARRIRAAIMEKGEAAIILATGASQFVMLEALVAQPDVDWHRVTGFHLDEYVGLSPWHPASFRRYLWLRFLSRLPVPVRQFHWIDGEAEPEKECTRLGGLIKNFGIDVAFVGIGENGHLAFNDPPADFTTTAPYLQVQLDEACRKQQWGEGWFDSLESVPPKAISMSIKQIMKSAHIVCTVPDERKAAAVLGTVKGVVTNQVPASILQGHPSCDLFLDRASAKLLD